MTEYSRHRVVAGDTPSIDEGLRHTTVAIDAGKIGNGPEGLQGDAVDPLPSVRVLQLFEKPSGLVTFPTRRVGLPREQGRP